MQNHIETPMFGVAIDDRLDFCRDLVGSAGYPSAAQREQAAALKGVVFDGLVKAIEAGIPKSRSWVWVDADLGEGVHLRARGMSLASGVVIRHPITSPSMLGHANDVIKSANRLGAGAVLVSTTYDPEGDIKIRESRQKVLRRIAKGCNESELRLFVGLMPGPGRAPRAESQSETPDEYATRHLVEGIRQFQDASLDVSGWVVEPPFDAKAAAVIAGQARVDDRRDVSVMFRVSNNPEATRSRPTIDPIDLGTSRLAARSPGIDGIMVGPGAFVSQLTRLTDHSIERETAVTHIAGSLGNIWSAFTAAYQTSEVR